MSRILLKRTTVFVLLSALVVSLNGCYAGYVPPVTAADEKPADTKPEPKPAETESTESVEDTKESAAPQEDEETERQVVEKVMAGVNVNQIGYLLHDTKRAVIRNINKDGGGFDVIDIMSGNSVLSGTITAGPDGGSSQDNVGYADFTSVTAPGTYKVVTASGVESFEFTISDSVYDHAFSDALRFFYLMRCGTDLPESLAGDFAHRACHTDEAKIYGGKSYVDVTGGWHDAGDYGRYVSPAAKAVADLMLSYELYPERFNISLNIPESGNGVPDVLNEVRYELEWMQKMQARDGGVHHKVTNLDFEEFVMSDEVDAPLYLLPESKTATADFAGAMFMAARVYAKFDSDFSDKCKAAAEHAIDAYAKHSHDSGFKNPSDVNTGEYADENSNDEYLWAICEGYKTTGDQKYEKLLSSFDMNSITVDDFGWEDMSGYAYYAYMTSPKPMTFDPGIRDRFFGRCDYLKDLALNRESYGCTIEDDYPWGSNMYVANNGMALLIAAKLSGDQDYKLAAKRQLDYLFGTNTTSYCFFTGHGTQPAQHPHHRPSVALGKCMKGMLVGGPASGLLDPVAQENLGGKPKAACYIDDAMSYSCNEVTIYWNSPLVFLLAGLMK